MEIRLAGVDSVIIYFDKVISKKSSLKVKSAYKILKNSKEESFLEIVPSYTSILLSYDIFKYDYSSIKSLLEKLLESLKIEEKSSFSFIEIDVYYSQDVGPDLKRVAKNAKLSIEEVIEIHSSKIYDVYAIGFLPGFAYMAEVDERIRTKRLETPRKKIPKGSVSLADAQTSVYPQNSPGGWNILGRTTFNFFDKSLESLTPLTIESKVKFNPISKEEYIKQGGSFEF